MSAIRSAVARQPVETVSDFGPCVLRGRDGRLVYFGAPEIILEDREDVSRDPDRKGNRPLVRGARRSTSLGELFARRVITKRHHDAAVRFLDALSVASGSSPGSSWLVGGVSGPPSGRTAVPERQLRAMTEVRRVMGRLRIHSDTVFWWVLVSNRSPSEFDRWFRVREGTGAAWLRLSLDQLDDFYHRDS